MSTPKLSISHFITKLQHIFRICSSMVCDPSFTTTTIANLSNDNGCFDANEKYPGIADEVDTNFTTYKWQF